MQGVTHYQCNASQNCVLAPITDVYKPRFIDFAYMPLAPTDGISKFKYWFRAAAKHQAITWSIDGSVVLRHSATTS